MHPFHADHAHHDLNLIAGHAAGDLTDSELGVADSLLSTCESCVELRRDLVAIATATRALPAPAVHGIDFRLAPEQADRLRRGSWLRGLLRPFAASGSALRPVAAAFTSLGIAGLFVATMLSGMVGLAGSPASAPGPNSVERDLTQAGAQEASEAPVAVPAATGAGLAYATRRLDAAYGSGAPSTESTDIKSDDGATAGPIYAAGGGTGQPAGGDTPGRGPTVMAAPTVNPLIVGSLALIALGLLLFGLRFAARRLR